MLTKPPARTNLTELTELTYADDKSSYPTADNLKPPTLKPSPITLNLLFRASGGCYGNRIGGAYTALTAAGALGSVAGGDNIGGNEK